jgi:hypothetical protein
MTWQEWLAVAGDAGSAVGGVAVAGALVGYIIRERRAEADNRLLLAKALDWILEGLRSIQGDMESWSEDSPMSADRMKAQYYDVAYTTIGPLDLHARGSAMRRVADDVEDVLQCLYLKIPQGVDSARRKGVVSHYQEVVLCILLIRRLLTDTNKNPFKGLDKLHTPHDAKAMTKETLEVVMAQDEEKKSCSLQKKPPMPNDDILLSRAART